MTLEQKIEAVLFYRGEAVPLDTLTRGLKVEKEELNQALQTLSSALTERGVRLLMTDDTAALVTAPELSTLIETLRKEELSEEITKAGAETLAIILYKGPLTRVEIDYLRGVNSTFVLRNLMMRGLIERVPHPEDSRSFLYRGTSEVLAHLGITRIEELPEFDKVKHELAQFEARREEHAEEPDEVT
jgi:segregation and condensation protein B